MPSFGSPTGRAYKCVDFLTTATHGCLFTFLFSNKRDSRRQDVQALADVGRSWRLLESKRLVQLRAFVSLGRQLAGWPLRTTEAEVGLHIGVLSIFKRLVPLPHLHTGVCVCPRLYPQPGLRTRLVRKSVLNQIIQIRQIRETWA